MTDVRTFIGCVLALLAAPAVVAQEPVIRVTTRLVEVSAVVHDRQGRPVRDLKMGDFEIIDNGKKQNIGLFRLEQTHAESTDEALPEGEVSNRGGNRQAMPGSYSVVLFDSLNTRLPDQSYARQQVLAFLREVKPEDRIAVCRMDGARLVILQDFTGVPCVVDLAAMRDALAKMGVDAQKANPLIPVDLVIDHSVQVDEFGNPKAFDQNVLLEYQRNSERYSLLRWAQTAFSNFRAVPPGTGIVHQVNLEYLAPVVFTKAAGGQTFAYGDALGMADDLGQKKPLGEGTTEVFPHVEQNTRPLNGSQLRHGQGKMPIRPGMTRVEAGKPTPETPHERRGPVDPEQTKQGYDDAQPRVFKPKGGLRSGLSIIQRA